MSELHLALLATAVVLLLALYGWNKWQELRQVRRLREQLGALDGDPLLARRSGEPSPGREARVEPKFDVGVDRPEAAGPEVAGAGEAHPRPQLSEWTEDPLLDCVLELRCAHAADGVAVIDAAAPLQRADCGLPVHLVAWDGRTQQWVLPDRFGFYGELLAAVQLANRRSRLGDIEASRFIAAVQQVAVALDADFDPPEVPRMRELAAQLETLITQFDVQIGLTLQPPDGAWNPNAVAKAAQQCGLQAAGERRWARPGQDGQALFTLALTPELRLVLELDVPLAPADARPLRAMFATATELAALLNAHVVDDHGRPIQPGSIEPIERQLDALYVQMRAAGIEPGSVRARRLYA